MSCTLRGLGWLEEGMSAYLQVVSCLGVYPETSSATPPVPGPSRSRVFLDRGSPLAEAHG